MNDPRFAEPATVIRDLAAEDIESHQRSHTAIIRNLITKKRLQREARGMTTMFPEDSKLSQQPGRAAFRLYWDFIVLAVNVYNVFQITYRIAFLSSPSHTVRFILVTADAVGDLCLGIDLLLKLYYFECDGGVRNLLSRRERDESYVARQLKIDLLALAPLCYFFNSFLIASLCRLPRLLHMRQLSGSFDMLILRVQRKISSGNDVSALLAPIKLLVILVLVAHLGACVFYGISSSDSNTNAWTHHDPVVHQTHGSAPVLYLRALYWSLTTVRPPCPAFHVPYSPFCIQVTLVGSREIVPLDIAGTLFACVACLCCTFVVGHVVGELSDMILDMNKAKKELHEEKSSFEDLARRHGLPPSIRSRALHYLQFKYAHQNGMDIYKTLHDLSPSIQVRLMMDLYGSVLRDLCIAPFLSEAQLRGLAVRLNPELFITGDTIIVEGNPGHRLYIIKTGEVVVSWRSTGTVVASLGVGGLFGEVSFFLRGTRRIASVQASRSCELLTIDRPSWDQLMHACASEKDKTEEALVQWARDCMKGYNVMVLETIKDVRRSRLSAPLPDTRPRFSSRTLSRASFLALSESLRGKKPSVKAATSDKGPIEALRSWLSRQQRKVYAASGASSLSDGGSAARAQSRQRTRRPRGEPMWMPGARPLPFIKASSFKNGTAQQVRPVLLLPHHQRKEDKLLTIEDECWRRYKSSITLTGSFANRSDHFRGKAIKHRRDSIDDLSVATLMRSRTMTKLHAFPQRKAMLKDAAVTDGFQGSRPIIKRSSQPTIDATHVRLLSKAAASNTSSPPTARLRRSASLPVFDHHFASKIAAEVAQSVRQASKTVDVSGEMVQRARQPEFQRMFHAYLWWRRLRAQASWSQQPQRVRARLLSWATLLELGQTVTQHNQNNRMPQEEEERLAEEFFEAMAKLWGLWECWSVLVGAVYAALLPYLICFSSLPDERGSDRSVDDIATYVYVLDVSCMLDLALKWTLFRGLQRSGLTVTGVLMDVFAAIPFDVVVLFPELVQCASCKWNYLGFLQLNKVIRIYQAKDSSERMVQTISFDFDLSIQDTTLRFLRSVCIFVLFGHWIACGWYRASLYGSLSSATSWFVTPSMLSVEAIQSVTRCPTFDGTCGARTLRSARSRRCFTATSRPRTRPRRSSS
ncbi:hypothetical protein PINS_up009832 [Pythium insidiosum]|nr:hypothetical protein PINS_up009832 [Pythium insidiosum]